MDTKNSVPASETNSKGSSPSSVENPERSELTLQAVTLPILVLAAGTAFLYYAAPILVPLVVSATLTYLLLPFVNLLKKLKLPHWLAVIIVMLVVLGIFISLATILVGELSDLAMSLPQYKDKIIETIQSLTASLSQSLAGLKGIIGTFEQPTMDAGKVQSLGKFILKGATSLTNFVVGLVLVFFLVLFMLLETDMFSRKLKKIFGESHAQETEKIIAEISRQFKAYIQVRFWVFIMLSIVVTIGLLLMDVPYAYIWGPLTGLLNVIPYIGAIISAVPPVIIAGIHHNSVMSMVYVSIFFLVIQNIEGNYITPKLTTEAIDLNAVTALISLTYWGWLWGGIGLLLAVPITAAIKVVFDHIEPLKPVGLLMGTARTEMVPDSKEQPQQ